MMRALLCLCALLASDDSTRRPAERVDVLGQTAFMVLSSTERTVATAQGKEVVEDQLSTTLAFPERVRLRRQFPPRVGFDASETKDAAHPREMMYLFGGHAFMLAPGDKVSTRPRDEEYQTHACRLALRSAALTWPHGNEWEHALEGPSSAQLPGGARLEAEGTAAHEAAHPTPGWIRAVDGADNVIAAWRGIEWAAARDADGHGLVAHRWPQSFELHERGELLWRERVTAFSAGGFSDRFFVPPDRRDLSRAETRLTKARRALLPARVIKTIDLAPDSDWSAARKAGGSHHRAELEKGHELSAAIGYTLDEEGRPTSVILGLDSVQAAPEGWSREEPGIAWMLDLGSAALITAGKIERLRQLAGVDGQTGPAYATVVEVGGDRPPHVRLVVPVSD